MDSLCVAAKVTHNPIKREGYHRRHSGNDIFVNYLNAHIFGEKIRVSFINR